ncbi:putative protein kinase UbiB [Pseudoruegeria aquimaris]|uniref:ABC1 atypical kinase-like domain-containing protein n=1 Tax=Pseudoruegeria aquimaris TaxID=393663 RepID=A0A1Y5RRW8_9RHOB|nr:2-polyprenylphenol 6-hydroxylase [Pseudoruegeria aquimaris]SLN23903.1 putative protein kinase UbiB [Pseudoruegeria aquimaris]
MRGPHNIWRLIRTGATLERTGAMRVMLDAMDAPPLLRGLYRGIAWPLQWLGDKGDPSRPPITRALTALGPAYIKFGQILSTRPDVVGEEMATELRVLQDKLPPFPTEIAKKQIAEALEQDPDEIFEDFSDAVAAASIAQVHKARLKSTGEYVAVKVLRPGIGKAFQKDIDAFYFAAGAIELLAPFSRRLKPFAVIEHFESVVLGELDLRLEAASASQFQSNTEKDEGFRVAIPRWELTAKSVLTMDWVEGTPIGDNALLEKQGFDRAALGARVLQLFLSHALRDGFFHGDMHQGNLKVGPDGAIVAYDFGIMGQIDEYTRRVYAEILYGFIKRDYRRVAEVHFEAGYVPADQDVEAFALALRAVGEPIFGMDASNISMGRLLAYLFEVTERFGMETRTELLLLQRTMVVVEGVSRSLSPHVNIWEVAQPVVEDYITVSIGPKALARDLAKTARVLARFGPRLPALVEDAIVAQGNTPATKRLAPSRRRVAGWMLSGGALALAGAWLVSAF